MPDLEFEKQQWNQNLLPAGVDEAGRGCLAGPVVAACVLLKENDKLPEDLNDSKKLSYRRREEIYNFIVGSDIDFGISIIEHIKIDEVNILNASLEAMCRAIEKLNGRPDFLLIDGNKFVDHNINYRTIVKGDSKSMSIAAASVLAKVTRDKIMEKYHDNYPEFDFASNKGYGTKKHVDAILKFGPCDIHRRTFLTKILSKQLNLF